MSTLTPIEKLHFEELFQLESGYVLKFTNQSFREFFFDCVNLDIYSGKYDFNGDSKAKHLRAFWTIEPDEIVGKVLSQMLEVWEFNNPTPDDESKKHYTKALDIAKRLQGISNIQDDESDFLKQDLDKFDISKLKLEDALSQVIQQRLDEARRCMKIHAPLSVIFLSGSILEGILLSLANRNQKQFNQFEVGCKEIQS